MYYFINLTCCYSEIITEQRSESNIFSSQMVHCDSTIDLLIPVLRKEKTLPSPEFVKTILKAFINGIALEIRSDANFSDPNSIKSFLKVYEATENFISNVAKISEKFSLSSATIFSTRQFFSVAPEQTAAATNF